MLKLHSNKEFLYEEIRVIRDYKKRISMEAK